MPFLRVTSMSEEWAMSGCTTTGLMASKCSNVTRITNEDRWDSLFDRCGGLPVPAAVTRHVKYYPGACPVIRFTKHVRLLPICP
jgi:hypothetical protein